MYHLESLINEGLIGHYSLKELETVRVKGKAKEVKIFEIKGLKNGEA